MISKQSDISELERLFDEYYAALLLYCNTIVKDNDNAADIVQQSFISLWQKMTAGEIHTSARAYSYKMVFNSGVDFLKHNKIKKRYETEMKQRDAAIIWTNSSEEKELQIKIETALDALPVQCGNIFKMSRFEGLKYREIATKLNISEKTVENQMGKALKILRNALTDHLPLLLILLNL